NSVEPDRKTNELTTEDPAQLVPQLRARYRPFFEIQSGRGTLHPEHQVERTWLGEYPTQVDAPPLLASPHPDQLLAGQDRLHLIDELKPAIDHRLIYAGAQSSRLFGIGYPLVLVIRLGQNEFPGFLAERDHLFQVGE